MVNVNTDQTLCRVDYEHHCGHGGPYEQQTQNKSSYLSLQFVFAKAQKPQEFNTSLVFKIHLCISKTINTQIITHLVRRLCLTTYTSEYTHTQHIVTHCNTKLHIVMHCDIVMHCNTL